MKPMGPIPACFDAEDEMLLIGGCGAASLVDEAGGTPLFVYDMDVARATIARFRAAMPDGLHLHYAIKANPFPPLLDAMTSLVDGFDIACAGELDSALAAGMAAGGMFGAKLGVLIMTKLSLPNLRLAISAILAVVAARMAWQELAGRQQTPLPPQTPPAQVEPAPAASAG